VVKRIAAIGLCAVVGACSWTQFDDLSNTTWAHAQDKPSSSVEADFGIAILPAAPSSSQMGGRLAVLGVGAPSLDVVKFDASGNNSSVFFDSNISATGIVQFPDQPLFVKPRTAQLADEVAIVVAPGDTSLRILLGQGLASDQPVVPQAPITVGGTTVLSLNTADAATYLTPPGTPAAEQLVVASNGTVVGIDRAMGVAKPPCVLVDFAGTTTISIAAMASFPITALADGVAVWTKAGQLLVYKSDIFNGCTMGDATSRPIAAGADTGFMPGTGARIHYAGGSLLLLASRQAGASGGPNTLSSRVVAYSVATATPVVVGAPLDNNGLHASAVATFGSAQFAILGFPQASVGGVTAGQVELHTLDATAGIAATASMTLNRAQPESGSAFGRAVSTMSYNGQTILAVGASNDVFAYYRLSPIYEDARRL
jgi:hypothetical protein